MSRISGFPKGLLDLLGSQNFGINPKELGDVISPVIDVAAFFLATKETVVFNAGTDVVANGGNTAKTFNVVVPAGELWYVKAVSIFYGTGAGETLSIYPTLQIDSGVMSIGEGTTLGASLTGWNTADVVDLWVPAGARFGIWGAGVVGVPTAALTVLASRLRA